MALLNLNTLLAEHAIAAEPFLRAEVERTGASNLTHIFSDTHLTLTRANPVEADAAGVFELCYLMDGAYTVHLRTATDREVAQVPLRLNSDTSGPGYRQRFTDLGQLTADTALSYGADKGRTTVSEGDYVKVNETGQTYRVAAADTASAPITTQGGVRFYINANRYDIKAEAWGVKMNGRAEDAANNVAAMQAAIDWLSAEGGGCITLANEGHMKIDHAIRLRDGVILDGAGTLTDNILTRVGKPTDNWGQDNTYLTGGFAKNDSDEHTWHALQEVTSGEAHVTLIDPAMADQYQPGDVVWIVEAQSTWGDGQRAQPALSEVARVISVSGGAIELEHHTTLPGDIPAGAGTIGVDPTGAWIANVDWRVAAGKGGGDWVDTRFVLKDAALVRHRLTQSGQDGTINSALFGARSGVYNCIVEDIEGMGRVANMLYGNGYVQSRYHNIRGPYIRRAIELKYLSQTTLFSDLHMWKLNHGFAPGFDEDPPVSIGEGSRCVNVDRMRLDVGHWLGDGSGLNLIGFTSACDCAVRNAHITGMAQFASAVGFPNAVKCLVESSTIGVGTSVTIEDGGIDCIVRDVNFTGPVANLAYRRSGTARGGRIERNTWTHESGARTLPLEGDGDRAVFLAHNHGLRQIDNTNNRRVVATGNLSAKWEDILCSGAHDNDLLDQSTPSTTPALLGQPITIAAGLLQPGDVFEWFVTGECLKNNGTRTVSWRADVDVDGDGVPLDVDDDPNEAGTITLPATCMDWTLWAKGIMTHHNRMVTQFEVTDLTSGTSAGNVMRHVNADFTNSDTIMSLSGWVADSNDLLIVRSIEREVRRPGYLT